MKNKGFTLPEILVMVMILSIATGVFIKWQFYRNTLLTSKAYADQARAYTNVFIGYLKKNQKNIATSISPGNPVVVSWDDLLTHGYVPTGFSAKNMYNQKPCLLVTQNAGSKLLYPIMLYLDGNNVDAAVTTRSMALLGGVAAIYNRHTDNVVGTYGLWSYSGFGGMYQGRLSHCGSGLSDGTLVINVGMMNDYNGAITPDVSLQRLTDKYNGLGESFNTNTAFTDIALTKNGSATSGKLYLNHNSSVYFSQGSINNAEVTLKNASLTAEILQPTTKNNPGLICSASQLGSVSAQVDGSSGMQSSVLVCSYNPPVCQAQAGNDYCYTPIKHNTIKYTNTGYMGTTFICPAGAPIVSDAVAKNQYTTVEYRECTSEFTYFYDCGRGNISTKQITSPGTGQFITTPIMVNGVNFSMQIGFQAINSSTTFKTCSSQCSSLSMSQYSGSWPQVKGATCACTSGTWGRDFRIVNIMSVIPAASPSIQYATCTTKMILTQQ